MRRVAFFFLMAWCVLLAPGLAQEADEERESFKRYFEDLLRQRVAELSGEGGGIPVQLEELWVDRLPKEGSDRARKPHTLTGGDGEYVVLALCDPDCTDIDLHLWRRGEEGEAPLLSDVEDDDQPLLVSGLFGGDLDDGVYTVEVRMIECGAEYCYFAVGTYRMDE